MIYLLTAVGLTPGGSSTVQIYTQTVHRTTQLTACIMLSKECFVNRRPIVNCYITTGILTFEGSSSCLPLACLLPRMANSIPFQFSSETLKTMQCSVCTVQTNPCWGRGWFEQ